MKKKLLLTFLGLAFLGAFLNAQTLDSAITSAAVSISRDLPAGSTVAVIDFKSDSEELNAYAISQLYGAILRNRRVTSVRLDQEQLGNIRAVLSYDEAGGLSAESAEGIGEMLGVQYLVTGSIGSDYRIVFDAVDTSAELQSQYAATLNPRSDTRLASLLGNTPAPASGGTPVAAAVATSAANNGWLGVSLLEPNMETAAELGLEGRSGALASNVYLGSPADSGGIKAGDFITHVNGMEASGSNQLETLIGGLRPGETATFAIIRDRAAMDIEVLIEARTDQSASNNRNLWPGVTVATGQIIIQNRPSNARGLLAEQVISGSPAGVVGLMQGDRITAVNGVAVSDTAEFYKVLRESTDSELWFNILRGESSITLRYTEGDARLAAYKQRRAAIPDSMKKLNTIGVSFGFPSFFSFTSYGYYGSITVQGTYSPVRNLYLEAGLDFGIPFGKSDEEVESQLSLVPYARVGFFVPFRNRGGWYAGLGANLAIQHYTFKVVGKATGAAFAPDITTGFIIADFLDISIKLYPTSPFHFPFQGSIGYVYRFK